MKSLTKSTLFTFFLSIGLGFETDAQRLFDAAPEHVQFQNKVIEDVLTINTDTSVEIKFSQKIRVTEVVKSNKKVQEILQTAVVDNSNYYNANTIVQSSNLSTPSQQNVEKEVYVRSYKVDYKGGSKYFPSSVEGEAFMKQLNSNYQNNLIPYPGNVNGYYTSCLVQGLVDYGRWYTKGLEFK
jgi:hypothetical protein